jgi:uridine kinase
MSLEPPRAISIRLQGGEPFELPAGTPVRALCARHPAPDGLAWLGALVNNEVVTLSYPLEIDSDVTLLTMCDGRGWRIYRSSVAFLLAKAVRELHPGARFAVEHSLGYGFYCTFAADGGGRLPDGALERVRDRMREMVAHDLPIERRKIAFAEALRRFEAAGQHDKYDLLRFRNPPKVVVYDCGGFTDLAHVVLADRTGALGHFDLIPHPPGFVLQFPDRAQAPALAPFDPQPFLFRIFAEHKEWGRILGLRTVGDLNRLIAERQADDIVRIAEALHEKTIARLADRILERQPGVRWIFIAGPSSSGKTTLAKRLAVQLRVNGLRPVAISVDDYFVDRDRTPRDEAGELDFEHVETVDLALFNEHLGRLDAGDEVELPSFNFAEGRREFHGRTMRIGPDQLVIVEGIHCLNPRLGSAVPAPHIFRLYVSALTQLNLDEHNRIATTDNRLLRRLVRDHQFRGHNALKTLGMWPSVRRGEKRWIFPFQNEAEAAFNSALDYELAVLKLLAEPLLKEVKPYHAQYAEARRLMTFLDSFLSLPYGHVPPTSILREFIGRSSFRYG